MPKVDVNKVLEAAQRLYGKDTKSAEILTTGENLRRPTKPEEFVLAPEKHPWRKLTGLLGIPYDSIVQVAGAFDSGKSTIAAEFMSWAQGQNIYVILGDSEKKFDKTRFENRLHGDSKGLFIVQSTIIRKLAGGMFKFIDAIKETDPNAKILVVHDSVGGSISRNRAERDIDDKKDNQPGSEAVENSDYMKHVIARMDKYPGSIAWILINQMTDKIGFGQKGQSRSGGHKISFHSSLIVEMKKIKTLTKVVKGITTKIGIISKAKVEKNHLSSAETSVYEMNVFVGPEGWQETDFTFDKGAQNEGTRTEEE